jgi:hypothetical protein
MVEERVSDPEMIRVSGNRPVLHTVEITQTKSGHSLLTVPQAPLGKPSCRFFLESTRYVSASGWYVSPSSSQDSTEQSPPCCSQPLQLPAHPPLTDRAPSSVAQRSAEADCRCPLSMTMWCLLRWKRYLHVGALIGSITYGSTVRFDVHYGLNVLNRSLATWTNDKLINAVRE